MRYKFILQGDCINGDCDCKVFENLIYEEKDKEKRSPPLHKGCHCHLETYRKGKKK